MRANRLVIHAIVATAVTGTVATSIAVPLMTTLIPAVAAVVIATMMGLAWVISDSDRTNRLTMVIDACRGVRAPQVPGQPALGGNVRRPRRENPSGRRGVASGKRG